MGISHNTPYFFFVYTFRVVNGPVEQGAFTRDNMYLFYFVNYRAVFNIRHGSNFTTYCPFVKTAPASAFWAYKYMYLIF